MKPVRSPSAQNLEDTGARKGTTYWNYSLNIINTGSNRRQSIRSGPQGIPSLLDQGEQIERPRAFPSPGLTSKFFSQNLKVHGYPTVHILRPRAVLSSPENDLLQVHEPERSVTPRSTLAAPETPMTVPPTALVSPVDEVDLSFLSEAPKAALFPRDELLNMRDIETSISDVASTSSTSSNWEHNNEVMGSRRPSIELVPPALPTPRRIKNRQINVTSSPRIRSDGQGADEENASPVTPVIRSAKKCNGISSDRRSLKQQTSALRTKDNPGKIQRPWY
ncbi:hypothetical protein KP509_37G032600 [Ceratopteris richardii]|uniref:Uncharacterized protein n=1 Tax=Ceratopteris richardii TaxID=49495 RepID=A0A8T2Q7V1_CERRI|nr:hypothetical protein KP509_37G032600 [Ceratopteris richardii]